MAVTVETLFDEFAAAYAAGRTPDVAEFLRRAGNQREELGLLMDRFLMAAPARQTTEEDRVLMEAQLSGEPPLLVLRRRRKLARSAVVDAIMAAFGISEQKRPKVADYYHRLETGLLDPRAVSGKVFLEIGKLLGADIDTLARPWPARPAAAYLRKTDEYFEPSSMPRSPAVQDEPTEGPDEVDLLFTSTG